MTERLSRDFDHCFLAWQERLWPLGERPRRTTEGRTTLGVDREKNGLDVASILGEAGSRCSPGQGSRVGPVALRCPGTASLVDAGQMPALQGDCSLWGTPLARRMKPRPSQLTRE